MSAIKTYLDNISEECAKLGVDVNANMFPGATSAQVLEASQILRYGLPNEIVELYVWRNGVRFEGQSGEMRMFPRFYLPTLERCVQTTQVLISTIQKPRSQWRAGWFSAFEDFAGDYLAINTMSGDSDYGRIFSVEELVDPFPAFWSLETMLLSVLECYKAGAYFIDDDGLLAEDVDTADPIYRLLNNGLSPCYLKNK